MARLRLRRIPADSFQTHRLPSILTTMNATKILRRLGALLLLGAWVAPAATHTSANSGGPDPASAAAGFVAPTGSCTLDSAVGSIPEDARASRLDAKAQRGTRRNQEPEP